jgi:molybdate transport system ATP-binding protein
MVVALVDGKCVAVGGVDEVISRLDLKSATERYEAGAVLDTRVAVQDSRDQLTTLAFAAGELIVPFVDASVGEHVRTRIRARDVSLALEKPAGISMLNVLPARVTAVGEGSGPAIDVQLAVGNATLVARITRRSFEQLGIAPGHALFALVKAVSLGERSGDDG